MKAEHTKINRMIDCLSRMPASPRKTETQNKIPEYFPALSIHISDVLDDIGAGKCIVMERRKTYLWRERQETIAQQITGDKAEYFHFGSQSEGTTTPGLNSDIDLLNSEYNVNIMTDWIDWVAGMNNLLILRDEINPPQHYLLQPIKRFTSEAITSIDNDRYVKKDSGQVLFSSERLKQEEAQVNSVIGEVTINGPSVSPIANMDMVTAFHVCKPLPEIQHWIDRYRGRPWPPVQLLDAARVAPSFLVPAGHPDSDYKREEWRMSPNLIERMLMFSFNITQIKCYIVLKLIKKSLLNKMVGDLITSFHCKTIMFYTIEKTHPSLWKEHNLMFLLVLCLQELRKWLRFAIFPHYIIKGVNLFDGKLSNMQQRRLSHYVDYLLKSDLQDLFYIDIDKLGYRLQSCGIRQIGKAGERELGPVCLRYSISLFLKYNVLEIMLSTLLYKIVYLASTKTKFQQYIQNKLLTICEFLTIANMKTVALELSNHLYALHNSMQSSKCLRLRNPAVSEIIKRFQNTLNTDVASNRLKLASTLYCFGHLHAAVRVLEDVENRYHSKVKAVCGCRNIKGEPDNDLRVFANMISDNFDFGFNEPPFAFCVKFVRQEAYCAPYILWFEMYRHITAEEVSQRDYCATMWMDSAEVDARFVLYYLQYLTYGGLDERDKQIHAFRILESDIFDPRNNINLYHNETALNLLGHCYEMEGDYEGALHYYEMSLRWYDTNNAANWHVQRVHRLISRLD